jgi:hypothetical protein
MRVAQRLSGTNSTNCPLDHGGMCEGWSLEIGMAFHGSVVRRDRGGEPAKWIASINSSALGEFLEREIAMHRVEELVEASMVLVLHDWDLYRAAKAKR